MGKPSQVVSGEGPESFPAPESGAGTLPSMMKMGGPEPPPPAEPSTSPMAVPPLPADGRLETAAEEQAARDVHK